MDDKGPPTTKYDPQAPYLLGLGGFDRRSVKGKRWAKLSRTAGRKHVLHRTFPEKELSLNSDSGLARPFEKEGEPKIQNAPAHPMTFKWDNPNALAFQNP